MVMVTVFEKNPWFFILVYLLEIPDKTRNYTKKFWKIVVSYTFRKFQGQKPRPRVHINFSCLPLENSILSHFLP